MPRIMEKYLPKFMEKYLPVTIVYMGHVDGESAEILRKKIRQDFSCLITKLLFCYLSFNFSH